ncbi:hypothetical protein MRQ36_01755 [Micromonospora sp. R77]|uniref:hypothetical protein n=1 Tax=Micromonospora sp. R77 TaxID=2925836 RepID=UPI001F621FCE|nr:hypothetical protein [Micromonospora sp. R77]MCI4061365.1 hypothetical protein [Micromonospora sp. R77]
MSKGTGRPPRLPRRWRLCAAHGTGRWRSAQRSDSASGSSYAEDFSGGGTGERIRTEPGVVTTVQARLILDNPRGPDDRDVACLVLSTGGTYWRDVDTRADTGYLRALGHGRFKRVTGRWGWFSMSTLRPAALRASRPPLP